MKTAQPQSRKTTDARTGPREIPSWEDLPLWPHQQTAVGMIHRYLHRPDGKAALVQLPTGTGKTGVMAVVAGCRKANDDVLIVGPWRQLVRQIRTELAQTFWAKLKASPKRRRTGVEIFTPRLASKILRSPSNRRILICTYQTLAAVASNPIYRAALRKRVGLVLADEGHREPAPQWSKAIRGLGCPTVLFTATPYRNDFRTMTVADEFAVQLSFDNAVRSRYIRELRFETHEYAGDVERFCRAFLDFFQNRLAAVKPSDVPEPRAIVRCHSETNVSRVAAILRRELGEDQVLAVHDRFTKRTSMMDRSQVPVPSATRARVWVHQNKLIEGLDEKAFCCVAFFEPFSDHRSLIQQIGRVIRNPERKTGQFAYVFTDPSFGLEQAWLNYRDYDRKNPQPWHDIDNYNRIVAEHVSKLYIGSHFRDIFDPHATNFHLDLRYHRSARVYRLRPRANFILDRLKASFTHDLANHKCEVLNSAAPSYDVLVLLYQDLQPSRHLLSKAFPEARLGYSITRIISPFVIHYDSNGIVPEYVLQVATPLDPEALDKLVNVKATKITQVALLNGDLGLFVPRSRSLAASALHNLPPALNDSMFAVSTTIGYRDDELPSVKDNDQPGTRRRTETRWYVGFQNATITQSAPAQFEYRHFLEWSDWLVGEINRRAVATNGALNRFARYVRPPRSPRPMHVLFDTSDLEPQYRPIQGSMAHFETLKIENRASEVKRGGEFSLVVNGQQIEARLRWEEGAFVVVSESLAQAQPLGPVVTRRRADFLSRVNQEQAFRIITDDGLLYARGRFAKPRSSLWGADCSPESRISQIIESVSALDDVTGEKEGKAHRISGHWDSDSVFGRIDDGSLFEAAKFQPEVLVCDDLGTEAADFIAFRVSEPRSIVIIHAKHEKGRGGASGPRLSAAAFHVVSAQVQKNMSFLVPDSAPVDGAKWDKNWQGGENYVLSRVRRAPTGWSGAKIADEIARLVRSPETTREVWIVAGTGLSHDALVEQENRSLPKPEAIQLMYLLHGTWNLVSMWGARFRVFCPKKSTAQK